MHPGYDVAVIGGGPAGLSAALILGRARRSVLVIDDGHQRNRPVRDSHGFLGHDGLAPAELLRRARAQLDAYPSVAHAQGHVDAIEGEIDRFTLRLENGDAITARRILFATGVYDDLPDVDGMRDLWGKRIFVCPYCDGWEFRDRRIAVLGTTRSALELAQELWTWSHDLIVCPTVEATPCSDLLEWQHAAKVDIVAQPVNIAAHEDGIAIRLADGRTVEAGVAFVCAPLRQRSNLPAQLGCEVDDGCTIRIDENGQTTVRGCYAAGDCTTRRHQIVFAASSAARAAIAINDEFYQSDAKALVQMAKARETLAAPLAEEV